MSTTDDDSGGSNRDLWVIVAVALVLKLVVVWQLNDHPMTQPDVGLDTTAYVDLARRVTAGDWGLGPGLYYVSPLYIYFLAAGLALTDSFTMIRIAQVILGAAAVGGVFVITRAWAGRRAAHFAAGLAALTGILTFYEVLLLQASLDTAFTTLALLTLTWALHSSVAPRWWLVTGCVLGVAALNRPNMLLAGLGLAVVTLVVMRTWRQAAWLVAGLAVGLAPVAARNVLVAGQWSPVSSHGGLNLYIGNHDAATGFYEEIPGITPDIAGQQRDAKRVAEVALGRTVTDAEASDYFAGRALAWMSDHPGQAAWLFVRKLGYTLNAHHVALPYSYAFYAYDVPTVLRFYVVGPWLLIPLGLVGLAVLVRQTLERHRRALVIWIAFVPLYAVSVAVFFVAGRYRLPLLVPLCVGAGVALDALVGAISGRRWSSLVPAAVAFGLLFAASNWRPDLRDGRWDEGLRMTQRLVILGRHAEVDAWIEKLTPGSPRPGQPQYHVGMQYLVRKDWDRAVSYLTEALRLDPGQGPERVKIEQSLGQAFLGAGRAAATPEVAEPLFRRGVELVPSDAGGRLQYGLNLLLLSRPEDAARELSEAVRLDPRDAEAQAHLALASLALGRTEAARSHAESALALEPAHKLAQSVLAAIK